MIALSTCYYDKKEFDSWEKITNNLKKLGFDAVELDVDIPESWLEFIKKDVESGKIKISSIHNFCPTLGKYKYRYSFSSLDEENRVMSVKYTKKTIELAHELGAKAVVIHAGEVETNFSGRELYHYVLNCDPSQKTTFLERQKNEVWIERENKASKHLENAIKTIDEIITFASQKNIKIGLENRLYVTDIPNLNEAAKILKKFNTPFLGYWHDVGHAEINKKFGFVDAHLDYLENLGEHLIGFHIHDIKNLTDHLAPGDGKFDFKTLKPYMNDDIIKVFEVHPTKTKIKIKDAEKVVKK